MVQYAVVVSIAGALSITDASASARPSGSRFLHEMPGAQEVLTDGHRFVATLTSDGWSYADEKQTQLPPRRFPTGCYRFAHDYQATEGYLGGGVAYCDDYRTIINLATGQSVPIAHGDALQAEIERQQEFASSDELTFYPNGVGSQWLRFRGFGHSDAPYRWVYFNWRTGRLIPSTQPGTRSIDNLDAATNPRRPRRPCRPLNYRTFYSRSEQAHLYKFMVYGPPWALRFSTSTGKITLLRCGSSRRKVIGTGSLPRMTSRYVAWGSLGAGSDFRLIAYRLRDGKRFSYTVPSGSNFQGSEGALQLTDHHIYLNALGTVQRQSWVATVP